MVGQARRRHEIFHHVIEAAAVHLPGLALDPIGQAVARLEAQIEMDEIERATDPADRRNDVNPAQNRANRLGDHDVHGKASNERPAS